MQIDQSVVCAISAQIHMVFAQAGRFYTALCVLRAEMQKLRAGLLVFRTVCVFFAQAGRYSFWSVCFPCWGAVITRRRTRF